MCRLITHLLLAVCCTTSQGRLIVIGDVHGDVAAFTDALALAGEGGGDVVQMGDVVDKGPYSDEMVRLVIKKQAGGGMVNLMGNHELLSLQRSTEYVHPEELSRLGTNERIHLFGPTGTYGRYILQNFKAAHRVKSTVFVHAGLTPQHARLGVDEINNKVRWAIGNESWSDELLSTRGPLWYRGLVNKASAGSCIELYEVLKFLSLAEDTAVTRLVIGHTIQPEQKVTEYCKGGLLAVDVGMSNGTMIGDRRRAVTILEDNGKVTIRYSGKAGVVPGPKWWDWDEPAGKSRGLVNQGFVLLSFVATVLTPCVAAASVAFLVKVAKRLRNGPQRRG